MNISHIFLIVCVAITLFTLFILLMNAFSSLEINEYGLDYSAISKTVFIRYNFKDKFCSQNNK